MALRETGKYFVNGRHLHLALREMRAAFGSPVTRAALAGIVVVVGISGPFGTLDRFALVPRMAYWACVVPLTYGAGMLGTLMAAAYAPQRPPALRAALNALGSAVMVALGLGALNAALGIPLGGLRAVAVGFAAVYVICLVIESVGTVLHAQMRQTPNAPLAAPPALLARLPMEKRGAILALCAQDHYTTVITAAGREMVLIRLADAIAEAQPTQGVQIHRSHWVALAAVASVLRSANGGEVELTTGARLPIARTRIADLRAAGLLARKAGA